MFKFFFDYNKKFQIENIYRTVGVGKYITLAAIYTSFTFPPCIFLLSNVPIIFLLKSLDYLDRIMFLMVPQHGVEPPTY